MKLEQQVCSLELAQKLKELGVNKPSYCAWKIWNDGTSNLLVDIPYVDPEDKRLFSAFTVAELGEMLPKNIQGRLGMMFLEIYPNAVQNTWYCGYQRVDDAIREEADSEANARAKCLIYLLEHGIIKL